MLRRGTPRGIVDWMLDRGVYLSAGRDTSVPHESVAAYRQCAQQYGLSLEGKVVCVVGAGGGFGIGIHLLEAGVGRVILQEPFAPHRPARDSAVSDELRKKYLHTQDGHTRPADERIVQVSRPLEAYAAERPQSADFVVSNSVLEHVRDLEVLCGAMERLLKPDGLSMHFVDLRDHYFRYPFEMLSYSESTWNRWLNASNNLNRLRLGDFREIFRRHFREVEVEIVESLDEQFARAKPRIRSEFLTGDDAVDAAAIIRVAARQPLN